MSTVRDFGDFCPQSMSTVCNFGNFSPRSMSTQGGCYKLGEIF
ncbi:hypothetical protein [Lactobacillus equicursoris]|nr:hypothetical protein [Lactobacillus equicursoris]MDD6386935.1 hypothetical protein [Lactobacillus equicursoris]